MSYSRSKPYKPFSERRRLKKDRKKLIFTIIGGIALVYLLFVVLLPNIIGGLSMLNKPKVSSNNQNAISSNTMLAPPILNIPYEATNTATIKVQGYALPDISVEIYLDDNLVSTIQTQADGSFQSDDIQLNLGTNNITGKTVDSHGNKSLASKDITITYNNQKPQLTVDQPADDQVISDTKVTVSGSVTPIDSSVEVDGLRLILTPDGKFNQTVPINPGDNEISITATDQSGNSTTIMRKVTSTTATPTPTPSS